MFLHTCPLCDHSHSNTLPFCSACYADLPWIDCACTGCGLPLPISAEHFLCGECLNHEPVFKKVVIPFSYHAPISTLINGFKHQQQLSYGTLLGELLAQELREQYIDSELPECILPVPLHWQRLISRGFNQTAELGKQLSHSLKLPYHARLLKRLHLTPHQQGLTRQKRLKNLRGAFTVQCALPYKRVALLDDVVTTGATATELGRLLLNAGVKEVHLWAIARTPIN